MWSGIETWGLKLPCSLDFVICHFAAACRCYALHAIRGIGPSAAGGARRISAGRGLRSLLRAGGRGSASSRTAECLLLGELNCVACHAAPRTWKERMPGRAKLSLAGVGSRLSADDLWLFVRSPQHRKKGTIMPGLFSGEDRDDMALEAHHASISAR